MKKTGIILIVLLSCMSFKAYAQEITGVWFNEEKDAKIKIYQNSNGLYEGKIVWLKNPTENGQPKLDKENDDEALQDRQIMGLVILTGLEKDGNKYEDGKIYDPKSGNTYSCEITPVDNNKLKLRGYIGISLFGRTDYWTRAND